MINAQSFEDTESYALYAQTQSINRDKGNKSIGKKLEVTQELSFLIFYFLYFEREINNFIIPKYGKNSLSNTSKRKARRNSPDVYLLSVKVALD